MAEPGAGLAATDADVPAGRADQSAEPAAVASPYELPAIEEGEGNPVYIQIPSIGVDAPVERVTLTSDGSMDVPGDPGNAGWYALGPRPGEAGSAAIAAVARHPARSHMPAINSPVRLGLSKSDSSPLAVCVKA